jgi:hypothetical protein
MDFLSLNSSTYYSEEGGRGFESNEEIFEWCAKGKLYTLPSLSRASEGGNETANDRQRYKKRPMFTTCMTEYYPAHPELFADRKQWTRDEVLQEALRYFPHAKPLYDEAMEEHARVTWEKEVLGAIKGVIPVNGERLNEVMRGLKRFVRYEGGKPRLCDDHKEEITERPRWMQDVDSQVKLQELLAWVGVNWSAIRTLECKRMVAAKAARGAGKEKSAGAVSTSET